MKFRLAAAAALVAPALTFAQAHPHYNNARLYLRTAQQLMRIPAQPNVQLTLKPADDQIEAAVKEIDRAEVVDRKVDQPKIEIKQNLVDRFRSIVELLKTARSEIGQEEDTAGVRGLRDRTTKQIDAALEAVHKAAIDEHLDREIGAF